MKKTLIKSLTLGLVSFIVLSQNCLAYSKKNVMPDELPPIPKGFSKRLPDEYFSSSVGMSSIMSSTDNLIRHKCGVPTIYQETSYWCGPASAQQLLAAKGIHVSQSQLALELGTTLNGTASVTNFPHVLNRHIGWNATPADGQPGYRAAFISGNRNLFKQRLLSDTKTNDPMIYNVNMIVLYGFAGGHYVTGNGWREKNGTIYDVLYVDPWFKVSENYYLGEKAVSFDLLCRALEAQYGGYVW